mgnify:CR=1 FL=1
MVQVAAQTVSSGTPASPVYGWGFFMASPTEDCTVVAGTGNNIGNSALITVPIYTASSPVPVGRRLAADRRAVHQRRKHAPLYVGGKFRTSGNSSPVGTSAKRLKSATVVGGCQISFHGIQNVICSQQGVPTSGTGSGIWANTYGSTPLNLTKPTIDPAGWYTNAKPGPSNPCGAGSTVGPLLFDNNGTRDTSLGTKRLLMLTAPRAPGTTSTASSTTASGTSSGDSPGRSGHLALSSSRARSSSTDNLTFAGNDKAVYTGSGTIYVNGTVSMSNGARVCGAAMVSSACSGTNWNPATNSLMLVAVNAGSASVAFDMQGDSEFEGLAYAVGKYQSGNSAWVAGPVIADTGTLSGDTKFQAVTDPPPGAPGDGSVTTTTAWAVVPGSWRQLT